RLSLRPADGEPRVPARAPDHGAGPVELVPALRQEPADVRAEHLLGEARGVQEGDAARLPLAGPRQLRGAAAGDVAIAMETGKRSGRAEALAFVTAFVTLFAQILVHRMASLKLLNNLAFLARRDAVLVVSAASYAVTLVVASWLFYGAGVPAGIAARAISAMPYWMLLSLLFAAPFAFCGLNLGLLLSSPDLPTRRVYGADLAGSALGAFAVLPAIASFGVETSAVLSA